VNLPGTAFRWTQSVMFTDINLTLFSISRLRLQVQAAVRDLLTRRG
jgi:hypothetical protein